MMKELSKLPMDEEAFQSNLGVVNDESTKVLTFNPSNQFWIPVRAEFFALNLRRKASLLASTSFSLCDPCHDIFTRSLQLERPEQVQMVDQEIIQQYLQTLNLP